jgi:hypothetical protein
MSMGAMTGKKTLTWIDPRSLDEEAQRELWRFVARYEELSFDDFERRISELSTALVARHASGAIGGIVAARIFTVGLAGAERAIVWGEWGLLDPPFRRRLLLERAMLHGAMPFLLRHPLRPVYFMGEVASWKGYLALVRGFTHLWPRPATPLPDAEHRMVMQVLERHGDPEWDPARAVFHRGKPMLSDGDVARVPEHLRVLHDFYRSANPGQPDGDSLLCVARVTWTTLVMMPIRTAVAQLSGAKTSARSLLTARRRTKSA